MIFKKVLLDIRKFYILCNWKINKGVNDTIELIHQISNNLDLLKYTDALIEIIIFPSLIMLEHVNKLIVHSSIKFGAQNVSNYEQGSYTGEISSKILNEINVNYVIIGHSERRLQYYENDDMIIDKIHVALKNKLVPVICVGENEQYLNISIVNKQIEFYLSRLNKYNINKVIFVYEPTCAINKKEPINYSYICSVVSLIRNKIKEYFGIKSAKYAIIQYGGSIMRDNVFNYVKNKEINGLLIGRSSLEISSFINIVNIIIKHRF